MRRLAFGLLTCLALGPTGALAQPRPGQPEPVAQPQPPEAQTGQSPEDRTREAREHYMRGMEAYRARNLRDAVREFMLASELTPSADLWYNIARAHEQLGEYDHAVEHYRLYLRDRPDAQDRREVEQVIARLEEESRHAREQARSRPTTGRLRVEAGPEGSDVAIDGRRVGRAPIRMPMSLAPGAHPLEITREGYVPFRATLNMQAGVPVVAYADLAHETRYRSIRGSRLFTWIVGGLGAVALVGSGVFGIMAAGKDTNDPTGLADARDLSTLSDVALGTGVALAVGALVLYFVEGRSIRSERVSVAAR